MPDLQLHTLVDKNFSIPIEEGHSVKRSSRCSSNARVATRASGSRSKGRARALRALPADRALRRSRRKRRKRRAKRRHIAQLGRRPGLQRRKPNGVRLLRDESRPRFGPAGRSRSGSNALPEAGGRLGRAVRSRDSAGRLAGGRAGCSCWSASSLSFCWRCQVLLAPAAAAFLLLVLGSSASWGRTL